MIHVLFQNVRMKFSKHPHAERISESGYRAVFWLCVEQFLSWSLVSTILRSERVPSMLSNVWTCFESGMPEQMKERCQKYPARRAGAYLLVQKRINIVFK